jgi:hypothetical protein
MRSWVLLAMAMALAMRPAPSSAAGGDSPAGPGTVRVYVHQHPDRVAALDDLVEVGTDAHGKPVFKTESELADSLPTLGCGLYARHQRRWYAVRTTEVLAPDRVFTAPSYSDREGGVCEFGDVSRGEYAGLFLVERRIAERDLHMTYSVPRFDVIPDALVPILPVSLLRWMAGVPWVADTLTLLQIAPTEDWATTRPLGAKTETSVDLDLTPPRPRYAGARFKFDPRRGDLVMHVTLRRLEITLPVVERGPAYRTGYVIREPTAGDASDTARLRVDLTARTRTTTCSR